MRKLKKFKLAFWIFSILKYNGYFAEPGKNLVNSILDETEKIKKDYRLSMLNGKMQNL